MKERIEQTGAAARGALERGRENKLGQERERAAVCGLGPSATHVTIQAIMARTLDGPPASKGGINEHV